MNFEWDEVKNRSNIRKHGWLCRLEDMFRGLLLVEPDTREDYGKNAGEESAQFAGARLWSFLPNPSQREFALFP
jgi:uncharacterized DUF497 family protein